MPILLTRRDLLSSAVVGVAGMSLAPWAQAAREPLSLTPLGEGLSLIRGAGAPVVVAASPGALLLVDGGLAERSRDLAKLLQTQFPAHPVRTLINTHWHWDRTGSNELFAGPGVAIIAHENTRLWLTTEVNCAWEPRRYPPRPARALPNQTFFYGSKTVEFAGQQVDCVYLPQAHTDGDIGVHFPAQNVLVAGGVASGKVYPLLDYSTNGWLGGMVSGLKTLMAHCDDQTRVIGMTGTVLGKADLQAQQDMCFAVLTRIGQSYYKGETWQQFLASAPTKEFDASFGDPTRFLRTAYTGAWEHVNEIRRVTR
jgi:cyclase